MFIIHSRMFRRTKVSFIKNSWDTFLLEYYLLWRCCLLVSTNLIKRDSEMPASLQTIHIEQPLELFLFFRASCYFWMTSVYFRRFGNYFCVRHSLLYLTETRKMIRKWFDIRKITNGLGVFWLDLVPTLPQTDNSKTSGEEYIFVHRNFSSFCLSNIHIEEGHSHSSAV